MAIFFSFSVIPSSFATLYLFEKNHFFHFYSRIAKIIHNFKIMYSKISRTPVQNNTAGKPARAKLLLILGCYSQDEGARLPAAPPPSPTDATTRENFPMQRRATCQTEDSRLLPQLVAQVFPPPAAQAFLPRAKNFRRGPKFALQEKESAYKVERDNPKTERFVKTGTLLLFLETA
ncbi:MAG: hypothetical protein KGL10_09315 [Alphaproteobacteria bacterium]|nr:hypothetical protein [Alphaproteobacteria bacterium]MDE2337498.1 hypothetical protein [Alphaproteobacteria bacterium]